MMLSPEDISNSWERLNKFFFSQSALSIFMVGAVVGMGWMLDKAEEKNDALTEALLKCQEQKALIYKTEAEEKIKLLQSTQERTVQK